MQSPSAVILEPSKIKSVTVSIVSPSICYEVMRPDAMILVFWMLSFKPTFSLSNQRKLNTLPKPVEEDALLLVSPPPAIPRQLPPITAHHTPSLFHYEACLFLCLPVSLVQMQVVVASSELVAGSVCSYLGVLHLFLHILCIFCVEKAEWLHLPRDCVFGDVWLVVYLLWEASNCLQILTHSYYCSY